MFGDTSSRNHPQQNFNRILMDFLAYKLGHRFGHFNVMSWYAFLELMLHCVEKAMVNGGYPELASEDASEAEETGTPTAPPQPATVTKEDAALRRPLDASDDDDDDDDV